MSELDQLTQEAREWIEAVTQEKFSSPDFAASLDDGVLLCKLMNILSPDSCQKISKLKTPFQRMENISKFLRAARAFGMLEFEMFSTPELAEHSNIPQVVRAIHALGRTAQDKRPDIRPTLGIKVETKQVKEFTEEQVRASRLKNAEAAIEKQRRSDALSKGIVAGATMTLSASAPAPGTAAASAAAPAPAPAGWSSMKDPDGHIFFKNNQSGKLAWCPDGCGLIADDFWEEIPTPDGRTLYYNRATKASSWTPVDGATSAGTASAAPAAKAAVAPPALPKAASTAAAAPAPAPAPAAADDEWEEQRTDDGQVYYLHKVTGESSWTKPTSNATAAAAATDDEWVEMTTETGDVYYSNTKTGATSWTKPASSGGASGADLWEARTTEDGQVYYVHSVTGESSWEKPT